MSSRFLDPSDPTSRQRAHEEQLAEINAKEEVAAAATQGYRWRAERMGRELLRMTAGRAGDCRLRMGREEQLYAELCAALASANDWQNASEEGKLLRWMRAKAACPPAADVPLAEIRTWISRAVDCTS